MRMLSSATRAGAHCRANAAGCPCVGRAAAVAAWAALGRWAEGAGFEASCVLVGAT